MPGRRQSNVTSCTIVSPKKNKEYVGQGETTLNRRLCEETGEHPRCVRRKRGVKKTVRGRSGRVFYFLSGTTWPGRSLESFLRVTRKRGTWGLLIKPV